MAGPSGGRAAPIGLLLAAALFAAAAAPTALGSGRGLPAKNQLEPTGRGLLSSDCPAIKFDELEPTVTHAPVMELTWVGADDKIVFATTHKLMNDVGGMWLSTDGGYTFADLTPKLNESIKGAEPITVMRVYMQKGNSSNVLLMNSGTYMWLSNDGGASFKAMLTTAKWRGTAVKDRKMHPHHDNWMLMLAKRPDCRSPGGSVECPYDLVLHKDIFNPTNWAEGWQNLTAHTGGKIYAFVDFDWSANLCPENNCPDLKFAQDGIFATMYKKPGDYDRPWDADLDFVASSDGFSSFTTQVRCGNQFELVGRSIYLAFANSCPTDVSGNKVKQPSDYPNGITLYTSIDSGASFVQACLPEAIRQEGYELVETHDGRGAVIVVDYVVKAAYGDIPFSNVYKAGPHHALFSLSLDNVNTQQLGYTTDFSRIEGIAGIYMANRMSPRQSTSGGPPGTVPDAGSSDDDSYYEDYDLSDATERPLVETRITFNGGGRWQRIPAPTKFNNVACDRCNGQSPCYLSLHGPSSWDNMDISVPAWYSNPSAPGLIMATGNVGPLGIGLDDNDGLCTWLSTDGGVHWFDVAQGAYIYEYADWGGLIIMARYPGDGSGAPDAADELRFSLDYGQCWRSVPLKEAITVDNIRIEPDGQRPRVIVHGRACRKGLSPLTAKCRHDEMTTDSQMEGLMFMLDIKDLMKDHNFGLCTKSDYDTWQPTNSMGVARCVLGAQQQIERRKQDSVCQNGAEYVRSPTITTTCDCTLEDTECDYGYTRPSNGTQASCTAISGDQMPVCPVLETGKYTVSTSGKRLVHGDVCTNIQAVIPDTYGNGTSTASTKGSKNKSSGHSAWFGFTMFLIALAGLSALIFGWWRFLASDAAQDTVRDILGSVAVFFASLWGLIMDKVRGRQSGGDGGHDEPLGYFQPLGDPGHDSQGRNVFTLK